MSRVSQKTRQQVKDRARNRCEYCLIPEREPAFEHSMDHVIAKQHGGGNDLSNLALCCIRCNLSKGTNIWSIDPKTGVHVPLFNPRIHLWRDHFRIVIARMVGRTEIGRATVRLLDMNAESRVAARRVLIEQGLWST